MNKILNVISGFGISEIACLILIISLGYNIYKNSKNKKKIKENENYKKIKINSINFINELMQKNNSKNKLTNNIIKFSIFLWVLYRVFEFSLNGMVVINAGNLVIDLYTIIAIIYIYLQKNDEKKIFVSKNKFLFENFYFEKDKKTTNKPFVCFKNKKENRYRVFVNNKEMFEIEAKENEINKIKGSV